MSTLTPTLGLAKPDGTNVGDYVDVSVLDTNFDLIDSAVAADRVRLTAAENSIAAAVVPLTQPVKIRKPADETRTNTTALAADADFVGIALAAGLEYEIDLALKVKGGSGVGGFKLACTFPASVPTYAYCTATSTLVITQGITMLTGVAIIDNPAANSSSISFSTIRAKIYIKPNGAITFGVSWAQDVASATATTLGAGSELVVRRIA
jgi:hypothetical protein